MTHRQIQQKAQKPKLRERTRKALASAARSLKRVFVGDMLDQKLREAAMNGHLTETERRKKIDRLLKAGANINARFVFGRTVLGRAALIGLTQTCAYLIEKGADVSMKNEFGSTAARQAQESGKRETASFLKLMMSMETGQRISFLSSFRECIK
jgi:ankyrin repeat protein